MMILAAEALLRQETRRLDRLESPDNTAIKLLQTKPHAKHTECDLTPRIQALPQEMQDEIHMRTYFAVRESLHWICRRALVQYKHDCPKSSLLHTLKFRIIVHHANELLKNSQINHNRYTKIQTQLVRIFAVYRWESRFLLWELSRSRRQCTLLEAAAIKRILALARECAELDSSSLNTYDVPPSDHPRFQSTSHTEQGVYMKRMPNFLLHTVKEDFGGESSRASQHLYPRQNDWFIKLSDTDGQVRAIISVEGSKCYTWLSLPRGGWYHTTALPTVKEIDISGRYGVVEWEVHGQRPFQIAYQHRKEMVFNRLWLHFDPKGAKEAKAKRERRR